MFLSLLLLAHAAAGQTADPAAPARAGQYQCVLPNREKKTCLGTTSYKIAGSSYEATTRLFLAPTPLITMELHTRGTVTDGKFCETVKLADFQAGTVLVNGAPADAATATAVKSQLAAVVAALDGKASCSAIKPAEDGLLLNELSIDGAVRADLSQKFVWVSEKDGYGLGM
ncbi:MULTISPECIES: hypothetical protein [Sphingomonas]|uniref:Uncharacterized protein n=1 Tax=Sphingomonas leidyi TaxID=68569 RepID=A0A7X5V032_9SPHN|nr:MULTISPECIES: hypothetical protein [Sphingomonas]MBN8813034.1 hypothetical protein [Sphingomonas sp.]NIJ64787.1 hypothetical protein [Sphingomonas leidyi]OJY54237.1 MAG: hypothetical protein BGP17_03795 [Sphingomonas sp. 67-41]